MKRIYHKSEVITNRVHMSTLQRNIILYPVPKHKISSKCVKPHMAQRKTEDRIYNDSKFRK